MIMLGMVVNCLIIWRTWLVFIQQMHIMQAKSHSGLIETRRHSKKSAIALISYF